MRERSILPRPAAVLLAVAAVFLLCRCATIPPPASRAGQHATLERKIMVGYQGWFRTPDDGAGVGWHHYGRGRTFAPGSIGIDYWPDVSELTPAERFDTGFINEDGTKAQVFSSHHPLTVERHFRWMRDYGIDGAFVQRFSSPIIADTEFSRTRLRATDGVLRYAAAAAEKFGRSLVVMYDLSGMPAGRMAGVERDWRHVVDDLKIRESPAYQFHGGKPLVVVWGVGFNDGRAYTLDEIAALIRFLKSDPRYGGNAVMLGIPTWWREQTNDAVRDPKLHEILQLADILSPWTPGRYYDLGGVRAHAEKFWLPDRAWCTERGIGYMPVVFPGFSWRNLKRVEGGIDRLDGRFLWEQYRLLVNEGFTMIYQAMFDEMDEGTQIFKVSNHPPSGAKLLTYAPLPSDYYLRLVGQVGARWRASQPLPDRIPDFADAPEINRFLRSKDDAVYRAVDESFDTHQRMAALSALLVAHPNSDEWTADAATGGRLRVSPNWPRRQLAFAGAGARVEWELPVPANGDHALSIRYPGDLRREHATSARLRVYQADALLAETKIDLRDGGTQWQKIASVALAANQPCRITLDQEAPSGALTLFEPRLSPVKRE